MKLHHKKKIEIITDAACRSDVEALILECGGKGYTVVPDVGGRGSRGVRQSDDLFGVFSNVLFIVVASAEVADRLVEAAMQRLERHARIVLVSDVDVVRDDHF